MVMVEAAIIMIMTITIIWYIYEFDNNNYIDNMVKKLKKSVTKFWLQKPKKKKPKKLIIYKLKFIKSKFVKNNPTKIFMN
jgi:hypothetical protein